MDSTYGLIAEAESRGGVSVQVRTESDLKTLAAIRYSRLPGTPHFILVSPRGERTADYLVTFQCGFLLRMLDLPVNERRQFASTRLARTSIERLMSSVTFRRLNAGQFAAIRDQFCDGLLNQLRSTPTGLRVEKWIHESFPNLKEQQLASIHQQLRENAQALSPDVMRSIPSGVFDRSAAMSIAFAASCAELTGEPEHLRPYLTRPQYGRAQQLVASIHEVPDGAGSDCALVDGWAGRLDMKGWYEWIPFGH